MSIPFVKNVKTVYKKHYVDKIKCSNGYAINCKCEKNGRVIPMELVRVNDSVLPVEIDKVFADKNSVFALGKDGYMYMLKGGSLTRVSYAVYSGTPTVMNILDNGQMKTLILGGYGRVEVVDSNGSVLTYILPKGNVATEYNGMLFIAHGNTINFSTPNNFSDFVPSLDRAGLIKTDEKDGEVVALIVNDGKLLIFTTHAIYEFVAVGARIDYTLKRLETEVLNVASRTVKDCGRKVLFLNDNDICAYENGKVSRYSSLLSNGKLFAENNAGVDNGVYCISVVDNTGEKYIYCIDVMNSNNYLIRTQTGIITDNGYSLDVNNNIVRIGESENGRWEFSCMDTNFYTAKEKALHEMSVFCDKECKMIVSGDYGSREFALKSGANIFCVNIPLCSLNVRFNGQGENAITDLRIKYRIKGE